jgi:hypothetical protein
LPNPRLQRRNVVFCPMIDDKNRHWTKAIRENRPIQNRLTVVEPVQLHRRAIGFNCLLQATASRRGRRRPRRRRLITAWKYIA